MNRIYRVRILIFSIAGVLLLFGFGLDYKLTLNRAQTELEYGYSRSLNDFSDYVSSMRSVLKKSQYVSTAPMRANISAELLEQSSGAKAAMSALPFSLENTERISRFISQIGDYAMALSKKANYGKAISGEEIESLTAMDEYLGLLEEGLFKAQSGVSDGSIKMGDVKSALKNVDTSSFSGLDTSFDDLSTEFSNFPELLYDGPFSDHILKREALFLSGKDEITEEDARQKAAAFVECMPSELNSTVTSQNAIACYCFELDGDYINITKSGGEVSYLKKELFTASRNLRYEDARAKAQELLHEIGIPNFRETYYVINDNMCTINFAYVTEDGSDIICYPDLIKVVVELEGGDTVEYDATGYIINHHQRNLSSPVMTRDEAESKLSPSLTVERAALALIPTSGQSEVLCWEFTCVDSSGAEVLVYVNTDTGFEEQIYMLQKSDGGILVQ